MFPCKRRPYFKDVVSVASTYVHGTVAFQWLAHITIVQCWSVAVIYDHCTVVCRHLLVPVTNCFLWVQPASDASIAVLNSITVKCLSVSDIDIRGIFGAATTSAPPHPALFPPRTLFFAFARHCY